MLLEIAQLMHTPANLRPVFHSEADFIINYDIKYRMGREGGEEEEK